jgi:ABC-type lipoprotein export system ATPase subunit
MSDDDVLVRCAGVGRTYGSGAAATVALQGASCELAAGAHVALVGPSGSGKSTLLHLMAGLDTPTEGTVTWPAIGSRAALRPGPVAVVFQGPSLMAPLSVQENVTLPLVLEGVDAEEARDRARTMLERLDLLELADKLPEEISGGQAQRASVARALCGHPRLILADEPTGQLDHASGAHVIESLLEGARSAGAALVVSTHDPEISVRLPERWEMAEGRLLAEPVGALS